MQTTRLRGARTNNLQGVDLDLAPGSLVVIAGPSGAGKSSLAFSTLYAEGQRRYVESFSAYARQFLERLARPPVDELEPIAAGIAVDRQAPVRTSRSTVGTMTEVADYAKSLWAKDATLHCRQCGEPVRRETPEKIADEVLAAHRGARAIVTYDVPVEGADGFLGARDALIAAGYRRVRVDGAVKDLDEVRPTDVLGAAAAPGKKGAASKKKAAAHGHLEVVADRTVLGDADRGRLVEALEAAMGRGEGRAAVVLEQQTLRFSRGLHCARCDIAYRDPTPGMFSFNDAIGACETCRGFGRVIGVDWDKVLPDPWKSLGGGAIACWSGASTQWERKQLAKWAPAAGVPLDRPLSELTPPQIAWLKDGDGRGWNKGWFGLKKWFEWLETKAYKMHVRVLLSRYRSYDPCPVCEGARLKPDGLAFKIDGRSIAELFRMPAEDARAFLEARRAGLEARGELDPAVALLFSEIDARLGTLVAVGLGYLALDRASRTLSGGESQRVALTSALAASLTGAMFVLDEPTVGLHPADVEKLVGVIRGLSKDDNLAIVVEHDADVIAAADRVIELGPGAGEHGGRVVFDGPPRALAAAATQTGEALRAAAPAPAPRRGKRLSGFLELKGASGHNLKSVDVRIPFGAMTCVTGPSGSGKSSLILETLVPAVERTLHVAGASSPLPHTSLGHAARLSGITRVDQAPLGRTSRGNAATYLGAWEEIRKRFAREPLAKERGYSDAYFSFNVAGGRCETCKGDGSETVEMQFLADVTFDCPDCGGRRFVGPVLDVRHRDMTVADVLELTASEAAKRFEGDGKVLGKLGPMIEVGLGYLRLGQALNTLSGGEAQRLKLALALGEAPVGGLVVLDEPTAGLHAADVTPLLDVLESLVARGDTVVVVEHDMRVAARADWVIDLGPGAGAQGGVVVAQGTPEEVARAEGSRTAPFLARALGVAAPDRSGVGTGVSSAVPPPAPPALAGGERERALTVTNAHEHNLKNVSVSIPREKLVVVTGPSGSGKSTLTFDVVFAEGQRRYLETLSPYARQYLPQLPRPHVDRVAGVPPTVALEQRLVRGGASSTVATVTEVSHYLRVLWARAGLLHCPKCKVPIAARSPSLVADDALSRFGNKTEIAVLAPVVRGRKGHHRELLDKLFADGFREARIDGDLRTLQPGTSLQRFAEHQVDVVVARITGDRAALEAAVRKASVMGEGSLHILAKGQDQLLSTTRACPSCGDGFPELDPRFFSFNTKQGQCSECEGHGVLTEVIGRGKTLREVTLACESCDGTRLSPLARSVTVDRKPITEVLGKSVAEARAVLADLSLHGREAEIGEAPLGECRRRLAFLEEVGLGYLGLDRAADTLSGGEMQRVRLAAQLGSGLTGLLYVLDEPTIGLHPRDTGKLVGALRGLVDKGNSVLVVEHDSDVIRSADHVIDVGPGGGKRGGTILAEGSPREVTERAGSITGRSIARPADLPAKRRPTRDVPKLVVKGARGHNLNGLDASFPLGRLVAVTGVSGSGKSTLVRRVLLPAVRKALGLVEEQPGLALDRLEGAEALKRAVMVDQSPIGRTPRSVPATYVGIWDELRKLFAQTPEARARGYEASRFSFNVAHAGRCPTCEGNGILTVEMAFLPDVILPCETCNGMRFTRETLAPTIHGASAGALLRMEIEEAAKVLSAIPKVARPLELLTELGLGYLELGQPSSTLSGGEAQRLKLVAELGTSASGPTLYVLDEPTTGLHREDVSRLIKVLNRFVERGDTVVVVEHQLDVILAADWVIDLGPEGGAEGGRIVAEGTPEEVATSRTHTGRALAAELARSGVGPRKAKTSKATTETSAR
ncbi:MAG: excinuclease ABC subunit UvrA [Sandaracinus sp.]